MSKGRIVGVCNLCGGKGELQEHHKLPRVMGGDDSSDNLISVCLPCHGTLHERPESFSSSELTKLGIRKSHAKRKTDYRVAYSYWKDNEAEYDYMWDWLGEFNMDTKIFLLVGFEADVFTVVDLYNWWCLGQDLRCNGKVLVVGFPSSGKIGRKVPLDE